MNEMLPQHQVNRSSSRAGRQTAPTPKNLAVQSFILLAALFSVPAVLISLAFPLSQTWMVYLLAAGLWSVPLLIARAPTPTPHRVANDSRRRASSPAPPL